MKRLSGIVPVLLVPLTHQGDFDTLSNIRLINHLLDNDISALWALGSASEDINLSLATRIAAATHTAQFCTGKATVVMGTGSISIEDNKFFVDSIGDCLPDAFHTLPFDVKIGDTQFEKYITDLADSLPRPLWLYHNPKRGKYLTPHLIAHLRQHPNIVGIKYGGYHLMDLIKVIMLENDTFHVIGAGSAQLFSMLSLGASAHTSSDACVYPGIFTSIFNEYTSGNIDTARSLQFKYIDYSSRIPRTDNGEYSAEEKYLLSLQGVCNENVNSSYRILTDSEKSTLKSLLYDEYGFTWSK